MSKNKSRDSYLVLSTPYIRICVFFIPCRLLLVPVARLSFPISRFCFVFPTFHFRPSTTPIFHCPDSTRHLLHGICGLLICTFKFPFSKFLYSAFQIPSSRFRVLASRFSFPVSRFFLPFPVSNFSFPFSRFWYPVPFLVSIFQF